jgi:hypothetical protein
VASRTRTLQQLRDGVADRGDLNVADTGVRHTWAKVDARINTAIQRWLLMQYEAGDRTNVARVPVTTSVSSTRGASNWAPREYIALPSGYMVIDALDIYPNGNSQAPIAMMDVDSLERNDALAVGRWWSTGATGTPVFYRKAGTQAGSELVLIYPWADAVYNVDIYAVPSHVDLDDAADSLDFVCGGEKWVVNQATMDSLDSDGLSGHAIMPRLMRECVELERELAFTMAKRGVARKIDTWAQRRSLRAYLPRYL